MCLVLSIVVVPLLQFLNFIYDPLEPWLVYDPLEPWLVPSAWETDS